MKIGGIDSPFSLPDPGEEGSAQLNRQVQHSLNQYFGQAVVPEDGQFSPATRDALTRFQTLNGLKVTGQLNPETLSSLERFAVTVATDREAGAKAAPDHLGQTHPGEVSFQGALIKAQILKQPLLERLEAEGGVTIAPRGKEDHGGVTIAPRGKEDLGGVTVAPRGREDLGGVTVAPRGTDGLGGATVASRRDLGDSVGGTVTVAPRMDLDGSPEATLAVPPRDDLG